MPRTAPSPLPAAAPGKAQGEGRLWQVDALRGLMLVLMTLTHVPTRFNGPAGQPFGYVSAAEGFVLLSAFMAGWIYTRRQLEAGVPEMRVAFLKRVLKIYLSQAALLVFLFSTVAVIGILSRQPAVTNLVSFYIAHPVEAIVASMLLVHNPPLLDILPMYILFMLASSLVLVIGVRRGWGWMLAASLVLWVGAQFGLGHALYDGVVALTGFDVPLGETGAFQILAWQLLWMLGLWMGATYATDGPPPKLPGWLVACAAAVALTGFGWRHLVGQAAFPGREDLNLLFDKWQLGPLRLLDLVALVLLAVRFGPWLTKVLPRLKPLEQLGSASLPVFCTHLVIALLALAVLGGPETERPIFSDIALLVATFATLYAVALVSERIDRHAARVRAAYAAARKARLTAGGSRSPPSRSRSRRR